MVSETKVYLAGPIRGLTWDQAVDWRDYAFQKLAEFGILGVSPLRGKDYLNHGRPLIKPDERILSCPRGIITRDHYDVHKCDILLVNLLGASEVSIGTMFECAWAYDLRRPIVLVMEKEGNNPHAHPFVHESVGFHVDNLNQGIDVIRAIAHGSHRLPEMNV